MLVASVKKIVLLGYETVLVVLVVFVGGVGLCKASGVSCGAGD